MSDGTEGRPAKAAPYLERRFNIFWSQEVVLRIHRPEPDGQGFACDYVIDWPERETRARVMGVDALQALILALQGAHVDLLAAPEAKSGELSWLGGRDLGLPLPGSMTTEDFL